MRHSIINILSVFQGGFQQKIKKISREQKHVMAPLNRNLKAETRQSLHLTTVVSNNFYF